MATPSGNREISPEGKRLPTKYHRLHRHYVFHCTPKSSEEIAFEYEMTVT
jgi:hypothetical protein